MYIFIRKLKTTKFIRTAFSTVPSTQWKFKEHLLNEGMKEIASYLEISLLEKTEVMLSFPWKDLISKLKCHIQLFCYKMCLCVL